MTMTLRSSKTFANYPCAHRQWRHDGNCRVVHGYSRSFVFWFEAQERTKEGFVVDFGNLRWLHDRLDAYFDHTLLLCKDDPLLPKFQELEALGACRLVIMPYGVGMEDTAQAIGEWTDSTLRTVTKGRAWVVSVEARENDKNSAIWLNLGAGFKGWL